MNRILTLVALLLFAFTAVAQDAQQPSLADAAKEKGAKKASHVFTNDEIPERPDLSPTDAPPPKPAAASAAKTPNAPVPDTPEIKAARQQLQQAQTKEANVAAQVKAAEREQAAASGADRDTADTMLQDKKSYLVQVQAERAAAEKALADAVAKAGGSPASDAAAQPPANVPVEDRQDVKDARAKVADLQKQQSQAEDELKAAEKADSTPTAGRVHVDNGAAQKRAALEQIRANLANAQTELNDVLAKAQASTPKPPDASDQVKPQQ